MDSRNEPWYVHVILGVVIAILVLVLVKVAIIDPSDVLEKENYYKTESRMRMDNIRQAEILWQKKYKKYTDNLDSLINFVKSDESVAAVVAGIDTITHKSTNPFNNLTTGIFSADSLFTSPKTSSRYILQVDTTVQPDSIINARGKLIKVDTLITIGTRYYIEGPDGYGSIGDVNSDAKKNTASWE